jgi:hypothetical protein
MQSAQDVLYDDLSVDAPRPQGCRITGRALAKRSMRTQTIKQQSLRTFTDQETIYASRNGNDRLLPGFKVSFNEYELGSISANIRSQPVVRKPAVANS